jgi:hypothetical protein
VVGDEATKTDKQLLDESGVVAIYRSDEQHPFYMIKTGEDFAHFAECILVAPWVPRYADGFRVRAQVWNPLS